MAIIKANQKEYHARVPNETARDKDLSLEAKGLLCILLSMDDKWKIYKTQIADFSTNGIHSTRSAFNELIKKGYIKDHGRQRDQKGLLKDTLYEVFAEKQLLNDSEPICNFHTYDEHTQDNRTLSNYTINSIEKEEKENQEVNNPESKDSGSNGKGLELLDKPLTLYQSMIDFWLKEFHIGWTFKAVHGQKIKSLITKFKEILKSSGSEVTDEIVLRLFKHMCLSLPEYYKDKDLQVLDSKFNEIITEIKNRKNGQVAKKQSKYESARSKYGS